MRLRDDETLKCFVLGDFSLRRNSRIVGYIIFQFCFLDIKTVFLAMEISASQRVTTSVYCKFND